MFFVIDSISELTVENGEGVGNPFQ